MQNLTPCSETQMKWHSHKGDSVSLKELPLLWYSREAVSMSHAGASNQPRGVVRYPVKGQPPLWYLREIIGMSPAVHVL